MADNVGYTPGSGATVAADDIGGALHQRVKLSVGADGSATDMTAAAGTVAAGTPRVTLASDDPAVASLAIIDDWDESDRAKVNLIVGQAGIAGGTGVDGATVPRVTLATNVALPAGTNAIGKLAANSGVDIGDVDVTSVPTDPFGANADAASATGSISAKLRFIAGTGIPITGTVTVGSHAVSNAGTFAVQVDGAALTALQKIDDPVLVDDAAFTPATSSVMMVGAEVDDTGTDSVDEGDAGAVRMSPNRNLYVRVRDNAGNERGLNVDANGEVGVTVRSGAVASGAIAAGAIAAGATSIAENEDVASAGGDRGVKILFKRLDTPANSSGTDGDYEQPQMSIGHLWVAPPPVTKVSSNFNRPADTTAYAANDAVADNTTAGSVTPLSWSIGRSSGILRRVRIKKTDQTVATPTLRLWLYDTTLTAGAGDNAAFAHPATNSLGFIDVAVTNAGSDDAVGWSNCDIPFTGATVYGLLQTLSAFTPANAETFTVDLWYLPG